LCLIRGRNDGGASKSLSDALDRFASIAMRAEEDLTDYYDRFIYDYEAAKRAGVRHRVEVTRDGLTEAEYILRRNAADEEEVAVKFIKKLHEGHYKNLKDEFVHAHAHGRDEYPKTLAAALTLAESRQDTKPVVSVNNIKAAVAYVTQQQEKAGGKRKGGSGHESKPRADEEDSRHTHLQCHKCHQMGHGRNCKIWQAALAEVRKEVCKDSDASADAKPKGDEKKNKKQREHASTTFGVTEELVGYC
jgi:hypothetical protein